MEAEIRGMQIRGMQIRGMQIRGMQIRGMQIRELVAALISAIIQKNQLQMVLQHHSVEQQQA
jgi:hypothetical protein